MICEKGEETEHDPDKTSDYEDDYVPNGQSNSSKPIPQRTNPAEDLGLIKVKKPHGGCGGRQPTIRKDGLKLYMNFKVRDSEVRILTVDINYDLFLIDNLLKLIGSIRSRY